MINAEPDLDRRWTLAEAADVLRTRGISLKAQAGGYRLNFLRGGTAQTEYVTDDLIDALVKGFAMAAEPPARPPRRRRRRRRPGRTFPVRADGTARKHLNKNRRPGGSRRPGRR